MDEGMEAVSRIVNVSVRCEECREVHALGSAELESWRLDVPVRFGPKEYLGDYCPRCFDEVQSHFASMRPAGPKPPRGTRKPKEEPVLDVREEVHVCPECKTFSSSTLQGLSVHRRRAHGVVGLHGPSRGKKKQPTRRVAGTLGGGA